MARCDGGCGVAGFGATDGDMGCSVASGGVV